MIHKLLGMVLASTLLVSVVEVPPAQAATWYTKTSCNEQVAHSKIIGKDYWFFKGCVTFAYTTVPSPLPYQVRNVTWRFWGEITGWGSFFGWSYRPGGLQVFRDSGTTMGAEWKYVKGIGLFRCCPPGQPYTGCHDRQAWLSFKMYGGGPVV